MMRYLSAADIYVINEEIVGQRPFVRDRHLLRAAAERPATRMFGQEAYPTLFEKAAALLESIAHHHLFGDGNKRTATQATILFLEANGCQVTWTDEEAYAFILGIAQGEHDIAEIARWIEAHTENQS